MAEVLFRVRAVLAHRGWLTTWMGFCLLHLLVLSFSIARIPGYELASLQGLLLAVPGGAFGIVCGRRELDRGDRDTLAAAGAAIFLLLVPCVLALGLAVLLTALGPCSPFDTIGFWPVIVLPSAVIVAAAGLLVGLSTTRWWAASLGWLSVVLGSAAHTVWPVIFGPQVSAWNHLAGFMPGPIYDEELQITAALLWFRLGTLLLSGLLLLWCSARLRGARRPLITGVFLIGFLALEWAGPALGFRMTDEALERALGGRVETEHLVILHPRGFTPERVNRIVSDVEFRFVQIADFVGRPPEGKVTVWWYRSAEQKKALVGAAHTHFAKPWRREVHVNDMGFPHPVIKHELAHAMLGPLGARPFGIPAQLFGLLPNPGLIEGTAEAAENEHDVLSLHEWTAAMKKRSMLPDVRTLVAATGFYSSPSSRAYTTAGSFVRWLGETRGSDRLRDLYRDGDFERAYGTSLSALADEWEAFLDGVPLDPKAVSQAFERFRKGSLFDRPCAREVARLLADSGARAGDDGEALELIARCQALQPQEPGHVLARATLLQRQGQLDEARPLLEALWARSEEAPTQAAEAGLKLADLALQRSDDAAARALLQRLVELEVSNSIDRAARIRLAALDAGPGQKREAVLRSVLDGPAAPAVLALTHGTTALPEDPHLAYLLGRRLWLSEAFSEALAQLRVVRAAKDLPVSLRRESLQMALESAWGAGRCEEMDQLALEAETISRSFAVNAQDWVDRCRRARRVR